MLSALSSGWTPTSVGHYRQADLALGTSRSLRSVLWSSLESLGGTEEEPEEVEELCLKNDFPQFLNQVTIQSFIFLVNSLKDRQTALWVEDFTQPVIRTRTKDKAGDEVLSNMAKAMTDSLHETEMERPIRLLTYHGLHAIDTNLFPTWESYFETLLQKPNENYLIQSTRPHVPDYEMDINPASLCSRLISVRAQIAAEFVVDLGAVAEISATQRYLDSGVSEEISLVFLEMSVHEDYKPSALRRGNFDLLLTLTTQEAIFRVLLEKTEAPASLGHRIFLETFYRQRIGTHFTGSNWYGRANDFLEELQKFPPEEDEEFGRVDPLDIVNQILEEREKVALEWLEVSRNIPVEHTNIRRLQLNRLMGIDNDTVETGFE